MSVLIPIYDVITKIAIYIHDSGMEYDVVSDYLCCTDFYDLDLKIQKVTNWIEQSKMSRLLLSNDFSKIDIYVEKCIEDNELLLLLHVLCFLDNLINRDKSIFDFYDGEDIVEPLNTYNLDKAFVIPKTVRVNSWTHTTDELSSTINTLLNSVLVIFKQDLCGYNIINHYINLKYGKGEFIVMGTPVCDDTIVNVYEELDLNYINKMTFDISYEDQSLFLQKVISKIKLAEQNKVALIVFPELISNLDINTMIINEVKKYDFDFLKLIALPTYYDSSKHKNVGSVYYIEERRIVFEQQKTFSYVKYGNNTNGKKELLCKNNDIHILHIQGVGAITFPICKDLLVDRYTSICRAIRSSLVIDRSFSPGEYGYKYFSRLIKGYVAFECCGFWINSCSYNIDASNSNKIIGITSHSKEDEDKMYQCINDCEKCIVTFTAN